MAGVTTPKLYGFDATFEKQLVTIVCSKPRAWGRVGCHLDPELFKNESAKLAMRAARAIAEDVGHGPQAPVIVVQRLRRWMDDGKVTLEAIKRVAELFDAAEDAGLVSEEEIVKEVAPMLQQRLRDQAVKAGIESYGKKGDLSKVITLEEKAVRIGQVDTSIGTILGPESFAEVVALKDLQRLPLGVLELDTGLDGGLQVGGLGVFVGGPGDGKSMALSHVAACNVWDGLLVAYATLELPVPVVLARIKSAMTGIPINALLAGQIDAAEKIIQRRSKKMGPLVVHEFTPYATTIEDIKEWVDKIEEKFGKRVDLLVVDYADKVGVKAKKGEKESSEYTSGRVVYEGLRIWANDRKAFCWTASQASRQKDKKKKLDLNDVADSMHKVRVADLVITLNLKEEGEETSMTFYIAKHRTGRSRFEVGPMPTEYECGRLCPLVMAA